MSTTSRGMRRSPAREMMIPVAAVVGWAGLFVHNIAEFPGQSLLSSESLIPFLVTALLVAGWFTPVRRAATAALLFWGLLHFLGGGVLSVLPLPFLPFEPEQTTSHYLSHVFYALAQLPLIISTVEWLRTHHRTGQENPSRGRP